MTDATGLEPVAIVGIGCRFPGASGPAAFWDLVRDGVDAIGDVPAERGALLDLYDPRPGTPGRIATRFGGYLPGLDRFDAAFFGIAPREAERLDPQQRLLLEVAWESLEDAGLPAERLAGSATGVFVGLWINDFESLLFADPERVDFYMTTGSGRYSASGRLSYAFGFQGPSLTVDTACSSSLVAIHLACQALRSGECTLALAGGANTIFAPQVSVAYSQSGMLAPDGRCKFGDSRANGYVRSEGAGLLALKTLAQAQADGDTVYAVILGSAVNNDGNTSGFLATPGQGGQEDVLRKAYRAAGVAPAQVDYVEAHGTGTSAGDPVELGALGAVLGDGRAADRPCLVGSVKTNIGHTEGAAGVAGVIKVALALKHREVPPSLHLIEPNPEIPWSTLPLAIPRALGAWPSGGRPGLAGVSGFGIAGTNAHVVLQEAPAASPAAASADTLRLLPVSARDPQALRAQAAALRDQLRAEPAAFADVAYTAAVRRSHHEQRLAVVARDGTAAAAALDALLAEPAAASNAGARVAFVFPGQGSQWLGMAREVLAAEPVFRDALRRCDAAIRTEAGFSVEAELLAPAEASRLAEIDVVQPTLFAVQVALAALWRSWGIEPAAVVGHSMGEVAAAHVAGVLSLEDAAAIICRRSRLLRRTRGRGAMAVVELSLADAQQALAGHEDRLSVAVSNSSRSTVLSGDPAALDVVLEELGRRDVFCRRVKVDVASHSPQMDALRDELLAALAGVAPKAGTLPLYSTVEGRVVDGARLDAAYWVRNLREPVLFQAALHRLCDAGIVAFLELSAHPVLLPAIQQELQELGVAGLALPSLRREEDERGTLLQSLGALYAAGAMLDWSVLHPSGRGVALPLYPWQRERFWPEGLGTRAPRRRGAHPLLGTHLASSTQPGTHYWEGELPETTQRSAALLLEMLLAAAEVAAPDADTLLADVEFLEPLPAAPATLQVALTGDALQVASAAGTTWTAHARARVARAWPGTAAGARLATPFVLPDAAGDAGLEPAGIAAVRVLRDAAAAPVLELLGMRFRKIVQPAEGAPAAAYAFEWQAAARGPAAAREPILVLADDSAVAKSLVALLRAAGETVEHRPVSEATSLDGPGPGVVVCVAVREPAPDIAALAHLARLVLVTSGAQAVTGGEASPRVGLAALSGAVRSLRGRAVDVSPEPGEIELKALRDEVLAESGSDHVALRGSKRLVPRLVTASGAARAAAGTLVVAPGVETAGLFESTPMRVATLEELEALGRDEALLLVSSAAARLGFEGPEAAALAAAFDAVAEQRRGVSLVLGPSAATDPAAPEGYGIEWRPKDRGPAAPSAGPFLILADAGGVGVALGDALRDAGHACLVAAAGSEWPASEFRAIVHLGSLDAERPEACLELLPVIRALASRPGARLWIVTRGAQPADGTAVSVAQAPAWGLGRVLALEQPEAWGGLIDLDPRGTPDVGALAAELMAGDGEEQVALRAGARRVARLVAQPLRGAALASVPDGSYVVTGGTGALGRAVAAWLVDKGARHLVLTSRRGLEDRPEWLAALEARGASVTIVAADASDRAAMTPLFESFGRTRPALRGVYHVAGVLREELLAASTPESAAEVLRPKVAGAWLLHELSLGHAPDHFVLFASAAGVWGSKGLGAYAAANGFLDALAHYRRDRGLPGLSVDWGWWAEGGITSDGAETLFRRVGLGAMPTAAGLDALGRLLAEGAVQRTVAAVDWNVFKSLYDAFCPRPLLSELGAAPTAGLRPASAESLRRGIESALASGATRVAVLALDADAFRSARPGSADLVASLAQPPAPAAARLDIRQALLAIEPGRRRRALLESHLQERVAQVLKLKTGRVETAKPFRALGLDSLMALELRNRLEADLGLKLSATMVWNHPTVAALAPFLAGRLGIPLEAPEPAVAPVTPAGDDALVRMLEEIEKLSDAEARQVLADRGRRP